MIIFLNYFCSWYFLKYIIHGLIELRKRQNVMDILYPKFYVMPTKIFLDISKYFHF
jgi:hypothetical protein